VVGFVVVVLTAFGLGAPAAMAATAPPSAGRWERVDAATQDFPPGSAVTSVVSFHGTLVAVGVVPDPGHVPIPVAGAVWTSTDGRRWQRVLPVPFGDSFRFQLVSFRSALYAVAAGEIGNQPSPSRVWRSTDGRTWRPLTATGPADLSAVVDGPNGLVAVGSEPASDCSVGPSCIRIAIWTSRDGAAWTRVTRDAAARAQGLATDVVRTPDGLVAVGEKYEQLPGAFPGVWESRTGARWSGRPSPELTRDEGHISGIAAGGRETLLLGSVPSHETLPATTTTTVAPRVSADANSTIHVVCESGSIVPALWTRTGTADWKRADVAGMGPGAATKMVFSHGTWVGAVVDGDCGSSRTAFVTSTDARRWHRQVAEPAPADQPSTSRIPSALTPTPSGAIAFLSGFIDPTASPDIWIWTAPTRG
jgi:hypothetical protein